MSEFGDSDPEDAYDASDPIEVRLIVIGRIIKAVEADPVPDRSRRRRADVVRLLRRVVDEVERG